MKRINSLLTVAAALAVTAGASLAQPMPSSPSSGAPAYGYTPPAGTPVTPDNQGRQGAVPPVGQQIQAARSVDSMDPGRQPMALLRQADRALTQKKVAAANELLERAQTVVLNGQTENNGSANSMATAIGAARQAVIDGDMTRAHQQIAQVLGTDHSSGDTSRTGRKRHH